MTGSHSPLHDSGSREPQGTASPTRPGSSQTADAFAAEHEGSLFHPEERPLWFKAVLWIVQGFIALTLISTLYYKFTYNPETQAIFAEIGGRPAAAVVGIMELVIAVLLIMPKTAAIGALLAVGNMLGAVLTHIFIIGIAITRPDTGENDGGSLFMMAIGLLIFSTAVLWFRKAELPVVGDRFRPAARLGQDDAGASG